MRSTLTNDEQSYTITRNLKGRIAPEPEQLTEYMRLCFDRNEDDCEERMSDNPMVLDFVVSLFERYSGDMRKMPETLSQLYASATQDIFRRCNRFGQRADPSGLSGVSLRAASTKLALNSIHRDRSISEDEGMSRQLSSSDTEKHEVAPLIFALAVEVSTRESTLISQAPLHTV